MRGKQRCVQGKAYELEAIDALEHQEDTQLKKLRASLVAGQQPCGYTTSVTPTIFLFLFVDVGRLSFPPTTSLPTQHHAIRHAVSPLSFSLCVPGDIG